VDSTTPLVLMPARISVSIPLGVVDQPPDDAGLEVHHQQRRARRIERVIRAHSS
jgi:hypothetical protein